MRLWYPQLDVYDAIRRISIICAELGDYISPERLFIADFFLSTPSMIYDIKMQEDERRAFSALQIPRPAKSFITYPAAVVMFAKMESIQRLALQSMVGKEIFSLDDWQNDRVRATTYGKVFVVRQQAENADASEIATAQFLLNFLVSPERRNIRTLRLATGLRRAVA